MIVEMEILDNRIWSHQVIQGSYKDAHWYSEPKVSKLDPEGKKRKTGQSCLRSKLLRRTRFQLQTQASLPGFWVCSIFFILFMLFRFIPKKPSTRIYSEKIARFLDWTLGEGPCDSIRWKSILRPQMICSKVFGLQMYLLLLIPSSVLPET